MGWPRPTSQPPGGGFWATLRGFWGGLKATPKPYGWPPATPWALGVAFGPPQMDPGVAQKLALSLRGGFQATPGAEGGRAATPSGRKWLSGHPKWISG